MQGVEEQEWKAMEVSWTLIYRFAKGGMGGDLTHPRLHCSAFLEMLLREFWLKEK